MATQSSLPKGLNKATLYAKARHLGIAVTSKMSVRSLYDALRLETEPVQYATLVYGPRTILFSWSHADAVSDAKEGDTIVQIDKTLVHFDEHAVPIDIFVYHAPRTNTEVEGVFRTKGDRAAYERAHRVGGKRRKCVFSSGEHSIPAYMRC
uniref:Uncharacterized protein n=1 Tax=Marseillevirus LCMAC103 TaxID=2506604 RepID=A0A481YV28_9VIRU|nr:MAG: hypothetical protein LCMAC103_02910 [Marseillevirus LCMAC103]